MSTPAKGGLRYLSVCSGIEAATVAWHPLGWQPVAFSEIEPFPSAVLAHHYPSVPNFGDMTKFQEWPDESIDLLVGGTPCQSFSVAGLRKGLEDPRGNLMLTYLAIAQRYRPRWVVWENVPGVLSSGGGRDFGTFLGALGELGYGWAYRVLDAQWFGVAQRRRRVFVVGHLGDWQRAAQVFFERESVRRDTPPRREARQGAAGGVGGGPDGGRIAGAVTRKWSKGSGGPAGDECYNMVAQVFKVRGGVEREDGSRGSTNIGKQAGKGYLGSEERAFTLAAAQDQFVAQPVAFHPTQDPDVSGDITHPLGAKDNGMAVAQPVGTDCYNGAITGDVAATLGTPGSSVNASGPTVMQPVAFPIDTQNMTEGHASGGLGFGQENDPSFTLTKGHSHAVAVAQPVATDIKQVQWASGGGQLENDTAQALRSNAEYNYQFARIAMQVRRLTPVECERLQGFPDGYTNIPWRKKPEAPDGPRYKALGNSMAVPCMAWIGKRIAEVDRGD